MPVFNSLAKLIAKPIPRVVTPRLHSAVDYISVGVFLGSVAWFWGRNKKAALGSLICGGSELALVLLTDYLGEGEKVINFRTHREMDYGIAAMAATMPESLSFRGHDETRFFRLQGALITLLGEITQDGNIPARRTRRRAA